MAPMLNEPHVLNQVSNTRWTRYLNGTDFLSLDYHLPVGHGLSGSAHPLYQRLQRWKPHSTTPAVAIPLRGRQRVRDRKHMQHKSPGICLICELTASDSRGDSELDSRDP